MSRAATGNIAEVACDQHARARPDEAAVIDHHSKLPPAAVTFAELHRRSARIAGGLAAIGVGRGARVAISLPQSAQALAWHLAVLRMGAISVPIAPVFAGAGLRHRLLDSDARVLATDTAGVSRLATIEQPPELVVVSEAGGDLTTAELCEASTPQRDAVPVGRDPAFIFSRRARPVRQRAS